MVACRRRTSGDDRMLNIAAVQMRSILGDVGGNVRRAIEAIEAASSSGADVVCLPEAVLTGYAMPGSADHPLPKCGPDVMAVVDATSDYGVCACFGFVEDGPYITQAVAEDGRLVGMYRKTHLGGREEPVIRRGDSIDVFRTRRATIGIQLCWESHIPEITGTLAIKGADIVLMPHASGLSPGRRKEVWGRILPARAYDNTVFIIACNQCGDNGAGTVFGGGAAIYGPRGQLIEEDYSGRTVLTASIDTGELEAIRHGNRDSMRNLYFLEKRRPELYFRRRRYDCTRPVILW